MNLRFFNDNLYPLFFTAAFVVAVACWFGTQLPQQTAAYVAPIEKWSMPQLEERNSVKQIATIKDRNLWNTVVADTPKAPEWRVVGIAATGAERFILLSYEGKPVATLKVGDALPDETKIVQIEKDRFFVMTPDKQKIAFGMYKNEPAK